MQKRRHRGRSLHTTSAHHSRSHPFHSADRALNDMTERLTGPVVRGNSETARRLSICSVRRVAIDLDLAIKAAAEIEGCFDRHGVRLRSHTEICPPGVGETSGSTPTSIGSLAFKRGGV